jgi:AraC family transcriptional regulator of adaptative response / DNA-3-methyladenine glycosylase II
MGAVNLPDSGVCYRAVSGRDPRFDGWIYVGITSTGIYCRPSCPARTPRPHNCRFFADAGAAQQAGFRACRRCRPDTVPGSPQWNPRADTAGRAMRLIDDGLVDRCGVSGLAAAVGYSQRQLNRLLTTEVGAAPLAIARARRTMTARLLIENTQLSMTDIAFAAGFASVRQFNDTVRAVYDRPPSALRRQTAEAGPDAAAGPPPIRIKLAGRQPYAAEPIFDFLGSRAIPGMESGVSGDGLLRFTRSLRLPHGVGVAELTGDRNGLTAQLRLSSLSDLGAAVCRVRRLFDLDADPAAIDATLAADEDLAPLVRQSPGIRVPGSPSGYELAIRALIGQQVSIAGATTTAARIVAEFGDQLTEQQRRPAVTRLFPTADQLAGADPNALPLPRTRGRAIVGLATEAAAGRIDLSPGADRGETRRRLVALPGIGEWTAAYIAMRALGDPDVLLTQDLIVSRELRQRNITTHAQAWSPWRSYATMRLWHASRMEHPA